MNILGRRAAALGVTSTLLSAGLLFGAPTPAYAGCPTSASWEVTANHKIWMRTSEYSYWKTGDSINFTHTATATRGSAKSASIGLSVGTVIAKAEAKYSQDWNESTSKSSAWTYAIKIPAGVTARGSVYKRGNRFTVAYLTNHANCTTTTGDYYYQYSPLASNDNNHYCIGRETSPGKQYVYYTDANPGCNS